MNPTEGARQLLLATGLGGGQGRGGRVHCTALHCTAAARLGRHLGINRYSSSSTTACWGLVWGKCEELLPSRSPVTAVPLVPPCRVGGVQPGAGVIPSAAAGLTGPGCRGRTGNQAGECEDSTQPTPTLATNNFVYTPAK